MKTLTPVQSSEFCPCGQPATHAYWTLLKPVERHVICESCRQWVGEIVGLVPTLLREKAQELEKAS